MTQPIHTPDYSISRAVASMAEEIATLNNVNQDLGNQFTKLESNLNFSQARIGELKGLVVSLQEERSALQLKLKLKRRRKEAKKL